MENLKFNWQGGESHLNPGKAADWMSITEGGKELLYTEVEWSDEEENRDEIEEQLEIFWLCLGKLAEQAEEKGIDLKNVDIPWDHYGNPAEYFDSLYDSPESLWEYIGKYFKD